MTFIAQLFYFIHVRIVLIYFSYFLHIFSSLKAQIIFFNMNSAVSNQIFYISLLNTVFSIIVRVEVVILYYSLHINRVFSRYTLTEIQIMTSSNVSLLHFFVCHDFCLFDSHYRSNRLLLSSCSVVMITPIIMNTSCIRNCNKREYQIFSLFKSYELNQINL